MKKIIKILKKRKNIEVSRDPDLDPLYRNNLIIITEKIEIIAEMSEKIGNKAEVEVKIENLIKLEIKVGVKIENLTKIP